jgi:hypothetical protein
MIEVVQGSPGSGKSAGAVARGLMHLRKGGVLAANFSLVDGWSDQMAKQHIFSKFSDDYRYEYSSDLYSRFFVVDSVAGLRSVDPRTLAKGRHKKTGRYQEGQGLLILDECQLVFNSRKWEKNMPWIEFFTQHRKLGWDVLLIAHSIEMIDSQIRPLAEYESRMRNMQRVRIPIVDLPLSPIPLFLTIRRYAGLGAGAGQIAGRDLYPLPRWAASLYNSLEVFSLDSWGGNSPARHCGKAPSPQLCGGVGASLPAVRQSSISNTCLWSAWEKENHGTFNSL